MWEAVAKLPVVQQYVLLCLPAIGQGHVLLLPPAGGLVGQWATGDKLLAQSLCVCAPVKWRAVGQPSSRTQLLL